jgi:RNA polymerase sigma factor (sigma-70 family)
MSETEVNESLAEFARTGSESAFAALVEQHVHLVYSTALRHTRNPDHAREITQAVFIILARKAGRLSSRVVLSGWLYQTTRLTAANFVKHEVRRQQREQEAFMQSPLPPAETDDVWQQLEPHLEAAMGKLGATDRNAVVLRFFERRSLAEVGAALGVGTDAAQKRVARALEKLRRQFSQKGITLSAAAITATMSAHAVRAAPAGLAKTITAVGVAKGAAASTSTLTLVKGALKIMAWTKMKTALVIGAAAFLTVGTGAIAFRHNPAAFIDLLFFSKTQTLSADEIAQYTKWAGTPPEAAARSFFEACGREDWTEAAKYYNEPGTRYPLNDAIKHCYGGVQLIYLGKPFWAWTRGGAKIGGVFVPYEVRFKDGSVKKFQIQVRCDNPEKRWYVDGGI